MGLPSINIAFSAVAATAVMRSQKGTVALIIRDSAVNGGISMSNATEIPLGLSEENKKYILKAFTGYVNPPKKVIAFVQDADSTDLTAGLDYMETQEFDYLCGPPDISASESEAVVSWIKSQRSANKIYKAVLPDVAADSEGIINFTTDGIIAKGETLTTAKFCSRIAGIIVGTPITISSTYAPLLDVEDITRLTKSETDTAINAGKFVLVHDGQKVKVGRAINSLVTTTEDKSEIFKKIKIVEAIDMIRMDIRRTAEDNYIGKYANNYDNKILLITAISGYFAKLENDGILDSGKSYVGMDVLAQETYLKSIGIDTSSMDEQAIKEANTGDKVFITAKAKILDAIEDIDLNVTI